MRKIIAAVALVLLLLLSLASPVLAEGGNGDGTGGGSDVPLELASSSVPDGSTDVPVDVQIMLTFNKNVVNMSVKDNNITCFKLNDSGGAVPVSVLMGDDQVDPTIKRIVWIAPTSPLSPGTVYTLTISGNLTSKSGVTLGRSAALSFKTTGAAAEPSAEAPSSSPPSPSALPSVSPTAASNAPGDTPPTTTAAPLSGEASVSPSAPPPPSPSEETAVTPSAAVSTPTGASAAAPAVTTGGSDAVMSSATPAQGIILWLICGGTTAILAIALLIVKSVRKRNGK